MKGTEKQVAWATDIINTIQSIFHDAEEENANHQMIERVKEMHKLIIKNMTSGYAGDIIEDFKDIRHTGKTREDYGDVINRIGVVEVLRKRNYRKEDKNE